MVSKLMLFAFLVVFMAGWSYLLCYLDTECRPFGGAIFFDDSSNATTNNSTNNSNGTSPDDDEPQL